MISFENLMLSDGSPIYIQILRHIKQDIVAGAICNGDELPSRRVLSALLGVNPNTVQKAYRMLEEEGLITSHSGARSYMAFDEADAARVREELLEGDTRSAIASMRQMGVSKNEALALIEKYWGDENA